MHIHYKGFGALMRQSGAKTPCRWSSRSDLCISKRGRRKLRRLLFQVVLPLIRSNEDFREVYTYYTTRKDTPLKGMQAMIAVSCKVIRIFYALLTHGMDYSSTRFRADIIRPEPANTT